MQINERIKNRSKKKTVKRQNWHSTTSVLQNWLNVRICRLWVDTDLWHDKYVWAVKSAFFDPVSELDFCLCVCVCVCLFLQQPATECANSSDCCSISQPCRALDHATRREKNCHKQQCHGVGMHKEEEDLTVEAVCSVIILNFEQWFFGLFWTVSTRRRFFCRRRVSPKVSCYVWQYLTGSLLPIKGLRLSVGVFMLFPLGLCLCVFVCLIFHSQFHFWTIFFSSSRPFRDGRDDLIKRWNYGWSSEKPAQSFPSLFGELL